MVEQARPGRMQRLGADGLFHGCDRDYREPALSRLDRDLDRDCRHAARAEDHHHVGRRQVEVGENRSSETFDSLDEHRLPLPVRANDLGMEGHRELDDRMEPGVRAVARKHLLDRNPRVARAEEMDETARGDGVGAHGAGAVEGGVLCLLETLEQCARFAEPGGHHSHRRPAPSANRRRGGRRRRPWPCP